MNAEACLKLFEVQGLVVALPTYVVLTDDGSAAYVTPYGVTPCKVRIEFATDDRPDLHYLTKLSYQKHIVLETEVRDAMHAGTWFESEVVELDFKINNTIRLGELFSRIFSKATAIHFL